MSIATEIQRINSDKTKMRSKLVALGLATSSANLDTIANAVDGIVNRGAPNETVVEGSSYSIQPGYYSGGNISAVAGVGAYELQPNVDVTPTEAQQVITSSGTYYGLSQVTVAPIPDSYKDITVTTATPDKVLANETFVAADGVTKAGTMPNNGAVSKTLDATANNQSYTVPAGYHSGTGKVQITLETKTATPSTSSQDITPTSGKVLSKVTVNAIQTETKSATPSTTSQDVTPTSGKYLTKVTVNAIPSKYGDVTSATASAAQILAPYKAVIKNASGNAVLTTGTMTDNGAINGSVGLAETPVTIPAGYTTGGSVTINGDIEEALALI